MTQVPSPMTQVQSPVRDDMGQLLVLAAGAVDALPWQQLPEQAGAFSKVLWRSGDVAVGLIRVDPGAEMAAHVHHGAHHHIWVVSGSATMVGQHLSAGSYAYIPPGVVHEVVAVGREGVTFLYTYRPLEVQPATGRS